MSDNSSRQQTRQPSSVQLKAARALLGITSQELARLSGVGWATVRRFEDADWNAPARAGTLERVKATLLAAGIEFIGDPVESPGVRLHRS